MCETHGNGICIQDTKTIDLPPRSMPHLQLTCSFTLGVACKTSGGPTGILDVVIIIEQLFTIVARIFYYFAIKQNLPNSTISKVTALE